jgi:hypothetical protein
LSGFRKKPPADLPNINSGKKWSEMDINDLRQCLTEGGRPAISEISCAAT